MNISISDEEHRNCSALLRDVLSGAEDDRSSFLTLSKLMHHVMAAEIDHRPSIKTNVWPLFDDFIGGLRPKEFTIFCGATGIGKTEFLVNVTSHLLMQSIPHVVWSVETGAIDYAKRLFGVIAERDYHSQERINKDDLNSLYKNYGEFLQHKKVYFSPHENRIKADRLMIDLIYANTYLGCKLAIIDNLNFFLEVTSAQNQLIETDRVLHDLVMLSKSLDMHMIMVMHPKKTEHGRVESEFDIKGSSTAVQEAHNVLLFNRVDANVSLSGDIDPRFCRELKFAKMRRRGKHSGKRVMFYRNNTKYFEVGER